MPAFRPLAPLGVPAFRVGACAHPGLHFRAQEAGRVRHARHVAIGRIMVGVRLQGSE